MDHTAAQTKMAKGPHTVGRMSDYERAAILEELGQTCCLLLLAGRVDAHVNRWTESFLPDLAPPRAPRPDFYNSRRHVTAPLLGVVSAPHSCDSAPEEEWHMQHTRLLPTAAVKRTGAAARLINCAAAEWESFFERKPHVLGRYSAEGEPYMPFRDLRNTVQTTIQRVQCLPLQRNKQSWHTSHKQIFCPQELDFFPKKVRQASDCGFSHFANLALLKNVNLHARGHG